MRRTLIVIVGLCVALLVALGALVGLGSPAPHRQVVGSSFVCAVVLNTYGICIGPPTNDA